MKALLLIATLFLLLAFVFGKPEYETHERDARIQSAPAFVPATPYKIHASEWIKGLKSFRVSFRYVVEGRSYSLLTTSTDEQGALRYFTDPRMHEVAYYQPDPSVGTLKHYYDLRESRGTLEQSLTVTSVFALALALPLGLLVSWPLGWLRRRPAA